MSDMLSLALDPGRIMQAMGFAPDPWQQALLLSTEKRIILNCSRQAGKSRTTATIAIHTAMFQPGSLVILLSPSQRQSHELFRKILEAYNSIGRPIPTKGDAPTLSKIEFVNGSRIIGLPGKEATIRGYSGVALLIIDEASKVPDDLYKAVRPMLAVSKGRLILLSTPFGQRGFFWREWHSKEPWHRIKATWRDCPRITPEFIQEELASLGEAWVQQEYECLFTALEGLVYPEFPNTISHCVQIPWPGSRLVGGIDWGFRNPFAAIWGCLDQDDVLHINGERYLRETPLHDHAKALPKNFIWYADPSGATEIEEMRIGGHKVLKGSNEIRAGIAAVTARIRTGRLKIYVGCENLIQESKVYRYPNPEERKVLGENPIDSDNHALSALRYLISRLDQRFMAKFRKKHEDREPLLDQPLPQEETRESVYRQQPWLSVHNEELWD